MENSEDAGKFNAKCRSKIEVTVSVTSALKIVCSVSVTSALKIVCSCVCWSIVKKCFTSLNLCVSFAKNGRVEMK